MVRPNNDKMTGGRIAIHQSSGALAFVLLWGLSMIQANCFAASFDTADSIETLESASTPLWGGAESLNISLLTSKVDSEIKLHHFDQVPCGSCHTPPRHN